MKLTFDANNTKVYDNILDQTQFKKVFDFMNFVPMVHKRSHGEWTVSYTHLTLPTTPYV